MTVSAESFGSAALQRDEAGRDLAAIMAAALHAVDPRQCVLDRLQLDGDAIRIGGDVVPLPKRGRVIVVGAGKAGAAMAQALVDRLGDRIDSGLVVVKSIRPDLDNLGTIRLLEGAHPVPDTRSVEAAAQLLELAHGATADDLVLCPISGGASALLCAPHEGITLEDVQAVTDAMLRAGVSIEELNAVRKHVDRLKGGGLALAAAPARVLSLIVSDVPGDDSVDALATVASGPTYGDTSSFHDAQAVLQRLEEVPASIDDRIARGVAGELEDNPRPGAPSLVHVRNHCVASNALARVAAAQAAQAAGYAVVELPPLGGEARQAGLVVGQRLATQDPGVIAIGGGETTVTIRGSGRGGRNQELALSAVPVMLGLHDALLATLATDGEDGPTDAAGAVVRGNTLPRALERELDPLAMLDDNDAYGFFEPLDDLIRIGPTGTNVCDLVFGMTEKA